jgi:hypothetical protein
LTIYQLSKWNLDNCGNCLPKGLLKFKASANGNVFKDVFLLSVKLGVVNGSEIGRKGDIEVVSWLSG